VGNIVEFKPKEKIKNELSFQVHQLSIRWDSSERKLNVSGVLSVRTADKNDEDRVYRPIEFSRSFEDSPDQNKTIQSYWYLTSNGFKVAEDSAISILIKDRLSKLIKTLSQTISLKSESVQSFKDGSFTLKE